MQNKSKCKKYLMKRTNGRFVVCQMNIRNIYSKKDLLCNYLINNNMDVILISETWDGRKEQDVENERFDVMAYMNIKHG